MMELERLEEEVALVRNATISRRSRQVYTASAAKFIYWLRLNKPMLCEVNFGTLEDGRFSISSIEAHLRKCIAEQRIDELPIAFQSLTAQDFMTWIVSLRKGDGSYPKYVTCSGHRAGLFNLYRDFHITMSDTMASELRNHFRGLKRKDAERKERGDEKIRSGKEALGFSLYRYIAKHLLSSSDGGSVFAHTFLVICWNLMCRAGNAEVINYSHMEWMEDALGIYFAHMKNDQGGERPTDLRHVYANPVIPAICPILSLGIYLMCFPQASAEGRLFPGGQQYERFRKELSKVMKDCNKELEERGFIPEDFGTHSMRKGAATYCTSGSTACPSSASVHLRAGWSMGGVQNTYLRYEAAGDQYVGRTVSVPSDLPEFALLPPFFFQRDDIVTRSLKICLPNVPESMNRVAEFCLASVVYHSKFLRAQLHPRHPLFGTALFCNEELLEKVYERVTCRIPLSEDPIHATGIPPHVVLLSSMQSMANEVKTLFPEISKVATEVIAGVIKELEARSVEAGTITRQGMEELLEQALRRMGLIDMVEKFNTSRDGGGVIEDSSSSRQNDQQATEHAFSWNGNFHRVPQDFQFPSGGVLQSWQQYCCGNPSKKYPPLKRLTKNDMPTRNMEKRLSDYMFLMRYLQEKAEQDEIWVENCSLEQANDIYRIVCMILPDESVSDRNRKRRQGQAKWRTMVDRLRKKTRLEGSAESN